ncbi:hypothetical protein [Roseibium aggregatum]|uniref:Uncharacterized protein n=1 Tax=Roseibium aggregatum TaxID=187304 RepID=A0A939EH42_9HYPH|nr:hypothetical protein [Roseibium aggregatum]MBN9671635.1 hypothetical protein [Roseibium aggregatum]
MAYQDRETRVVEKTAGTGAAWFIAGILVAGAIIGGILYTNGYFTDDDVSIELKLPGISAQ